MGDRANFGFKQGDNTLFLYGHTAGEGMMNTLATALKAAEPRWNDDAYGTRITISHIIGHDWTSEYGWGLSINSLRDNEHSVPIVNWADGTVSLYSASWDKPFVQDNPKFTMPISAFVDKFMK